MNPPRAASGPLFAVIAALGFATLGIWGKLATGAGFSSFVALGWRFALVAVVLLLLAGRGLTWAQRRPMLATGLLYAVATHVYFAALTRISAGTTSLLLYLAPAFVILLSWGLGRAPTRAQLGALALAAAGLALITGLPGPADADRLGLGLAATSGALYALYLLASERFLRGLPVLASTGHMALVAGAYFLSFTALQGDFQVPQTPAQFGIVLGMAVVATLIAVPALYAAVERLGAASASLIATLEPVLAVLLAALILGEALRPSVLAGGLLILGGAVLAQRGGAALRPEASAAPRPAPPGSPAGRPDAAPPPPPP